MESSYKLFLSPYKNVFGYFCLLSGNQAYVGRAQVMHNTNIFIIRV